MAFGRGSTAESPYVVAECPARARFLFLKATSTKESRLSVCEIIIDGEDICGSSADCKDVRRPRCDLRSKKCVGCLSNEDCNSNQRCESFFCTADGDSLHVGVTQFMTFWGRKRASELRQMHGWTRWNCTQFMTLNFRQITPYRDSSCLFLDGSKMAASDPDILFHFQDGDTFAEFRSPMVIENWARLFDEPTLVWSFQVAFKLKDDSSLGSYKTLLFSGDSTSGVSSSSLILRMRTLFGSKSPIRHMSSQTNATVISLPDESLKLQVELKTDKSNPNGPPFRSYVTLDQNGMAASAVHRVIVEYDAMAEKLVYFLGSRDPTYPWVRVEGKESVSGLLVNPKKFKLFFGLENRHLIGKFAVAKRRFHDEEKRKFFTASLD